VTHYQVDAACVAPPAGTLAGELPLNMFHPVMQSASTSAAVEGLPPGGTWFVRVWAQNRHGTALSHCVSSHCVSYHLADYGVPHRLTVYSIAECVSHSHPHYGVSHRLALMITFPSVCLPLRKLARERRRGGSHAAAAARRTRRTRTRRRAQGAREPPYTT
jgi:hypothetical protein